MRLSRVAFALLIAGVFAHAQSPAFDVVSIKVSPPETGPNRSANIFRQTPDGGLTVIRMFIGNLIGRAYEPIARPEMYGLPDWATREFYDISATSPLTAATPEQRTAMLRGMLADRFKLLAHTERRDLPAYDLVLDRKDGRLGPGLVPSDLDCEAIAAARRAAAASGSSDFDPTRPSPCSIRGSGDSISGVAAISVLAQILRTSTGRLVVDKTGLRGAYRMDLMFDQVVVLGGGIPTENSLSVFTAVREQLGLRLESSRAERDVLIIDRLERPTEN